MTRSCRMVFPFTLFLLVSSSLNADVNRVACVGDSITFGAGVKDRAKNCYPVQLGILIGDSYDVRNFGVNGATMLKKGDKPYWKQKAFRAATEFKPHIVVIKLGTNDTKPQNWKHKDEFDDDVNAMIDHFSALESKPTIYLCRPVPAFPERWGIDNTRIRGEVIPIVNEVGKERQLPVVDLYTPFVGKRKYFPDRIHPNAAGAKLIAEIVGSHIAVFPAAHSGLPKGLPTELPSGYKLVHEADLSSPSALDAFQFTDRNAWRQGREGRRDYIELFAKSKYKYKVRSPYNIALIAQKQFGSFVMDCELRQTGREYGHRDMCLFYNFQDRSHFYYTHISSASDPHAHQIFIVNGKPRTAISKTTSKGHKWGKAWHHVRFLRDIENGKIEIYVNDMSKPIMTAADQTFGWGHVGFGSFDDTGRVANVKIYAKESRDVQTEKNLFAD